MFVAEDKIHTYSLTLRSALNKREGYKRFAIIQHVLILQ